ncbi:MAG: hypothetical protein ABW019_12325 [Chitinophagaceae bacterium]
MRFVILLPALLAGLCITAQQPLPPIGLWREHLPYTSAIDVAAGNGKLFCATPYSLFTVSREDNSIERWSRITGLSETGISAIGYDAAGDKLFIAYRSSNIDIIHRSDIINLPDVKRDNIAGDKTIYAVYPLQKDFYLSTGLGIIVINGERYEVKDTWFIGSGGSQVKVNGLTSDGSFFYAATEQGLKKAALTASLADPASWVQVSGSAGLPAGSCRNVLTAQGRVIALVHDSLFVQNGSSWSLFYEDGWPVISTAVSENKITICQRRPSGESRVVILNADGTVSRILAQPGIIAFPRKAITEQTGTWIADSLKGLVYHTGSAYEPIRPNSPDGIASGELTVYNDVFYAAAGEVDDNWNPRFNTNGVYRLKEGVWTNINRNYFSKLDTVPDCITLAIDPADEAAWVGSFGGGLLRIGAGLSLDIIKQGVLAPAAGNPGSYRVAGLAFDQNRSLWVSNYGAPQPLLARKSDGAWLKFSVPFFLSENQLTQIIVDDNNFKWIVAAKGGGVIVYDAGASLENTGDDRWKLFTTGAGNGNLPGEPLCLAKDKSGFIWVGTRNGIGVIQCPGEIFTAGGCEAIWPVVEAGNFAGYLFNGEQVRSIAVDGADRKWVATANGVWLTGATGQEVIYRFTEDNSPLLSNDVKKITVNGKTGEVFFATAKGICSFRSTATEGGGTSQDILVFPNPVPPGYTGSIAIRGVVNNAIVKITEPGGRLVYQTRALGGQAVWDGRDYRGRRISSGVYLVLISDEERAEKAAGKIVFISK